jgi:hypothetical protein
MRSKKGIDMAILMNKTGFIRILTYTLFFTAALYNAPPGRVGMEAANELFPFFKARPEGRGR